MSPRKRHSRKGASDGYHAAENPFAPFAAPAAENWAPRDGVFITPPLSAPENAEELLQSMLASISMPWPPRTYAAYWLTWELLRRSEKHWSQAWWLRNDAVVIDSRSAGARGAHVAAIERSVPPRGFRFPPPVGDNCPKDGFVFESTLRSLFVGSTEAPLVLVYEGATRRHHSWCWATVLEATPSRVRVDLDLRATDERIVAAVRHLRSTLKVKLYRRHRDASFWGSVDAAEVVRFLNFLVEGGSAYDWAKTHVDERDIKTRANRWQALRRHLLHALCDDPFLPLRA